MRFIALTSAAAIGLLSFAVHGVTATTTPKETFVTKLRFTTRDFQSRALASTNLKQYADETARIGVGGEVCVDIGSINYIPSGLDTNVTVHRLSESKVRVDLHVSDIKLDRSTEGDVQLRETGVHCIKDVGLGEKFVADVSENVRVKASIELAETK